MLILALTSLLAAPPTVPVSTENPWFVSLRPAVVVLEPEPIVEPSEGTAVEEAPVAASNPPVVLAPAKTVKSRPAKTIKRVPKRSTK